MCLRVWDPRGAKSRVVYNIHNLGFSGLEMWRIERALMADIATARADLTNSSLILIGDFSLHPEDDPKVKVDCPALLSYSAAGGKPLTARWYRIFDSMVEIFSPS